MKKTVKMFIILLIIGIAISSCLVRATTSIPSATPQEDGIDLSGQNATLQAIIGEQEAMLESLKTLSAPLQPTDTVFPQETAVVFPQATALPPTPEDSTTINSNGLVFTLPFAVAQGAIVETIPADGPEQVWPEFALPAHRTISFSDYPVENHLLTPIIYVYPLEEMINDGKIGGSRALILRNLLENPGFDLQADEDLPFLPPFNAAQMFHVLEQRLDSEHTRAIRYLTLYSQAYVGIDNYNVFYTYQGLTKDGRYYIAAVLPIHSSLLSDTQATPEEMQQYSNYYPAYIYGMREMITNQNGGVLTPSLEDLDAMMMSLVSFD